MQVDADLQNQNLRTDLRWVAKRIRKSARKFMQVAKSRKFHEYLSSAKQASERSRWKSTHVGGQTKRKLNASLKFVLTCESVWPGLKMCQLVGTWCWC